MQEINHGTRTDAAFYTLHPALRRLRPLPTAPPQQLRPTGLDQSPGPDPDWDWVWLGHGLFLWPDRVLSPFPDLPQRLWCGPHTGGRHPVPQRGEGPPSTLAPGRLFSPWPPPVSAGVQSNWQVFMAASSLKPIYPIQGEANMEES